MAVLVRYGIQHKKRKDLESMDEKEVESTFIEMMAKNGKKFIVGSLYRAPNMKADNFVNYIEKTVNKVKVDRGSKEFIMGMDHNLNLLKANHHKKMGQFLDLMTDLGMTPTITRPTRLTNNTATLIDNVFIGGNLQWNFESYLIIADISDHLLSLILLKQTKLSDTAPIEFESRNLNKTKIEKINEELCKVD